MLHTGTQTIESGRLLLRRFVLSDAEDMLRSWISQPQVQEEYGEPVYTDIGQVNELLGRWIDEYERPDFYRWAVIEKASGECIGQIAFCRVYDDIAAAEIEYCIGSAFWGHGYAGEALSAVISHTFEHTGFLKLEAYHRAENVKSGRVLEKSLMHVTDNVERFRRQGAEPEGEVCYCIER